METVAEVPIWKESIGEGWKQEGRDATAGSLALAQVYSGTMRMRIRGEELQSPSSIRLRGIGQTVTGCRRALPDVWPRTRWPVLIEGFLCEIRVGGLHDLPPYSRVRTGTSWRRSIMNMPAAPSAAMTAAADTIGRPLVAIGAAVNVCIVTALGPQLDSGERSIGCAPPPA